MDVRRRSRRIFWAHCAITILPAAAAAGLVAGILGAPLLAVGVVAGSVYGFLVMILYLHYLNHFHPRLVEQAMVEQLRGKGYVVHEPNGDTAPSAN